MPQTSLGLLPPPLAAHRRGVAAAATLMPAIVPLGLALGVALGAMSHPPVVTWLSAPLMLAGASQLVLFSQLESGSGVAAAVAAAVLLNSRFAVYGAALSPRFGCGQPMWFRLIGPHYIVDQTYAVTMTGVHEGDTDDDFRHYFATAGTVLLVVWSCSVGIGIIGGPILPSALPLEFVLPATFIALIVPGLRRRSEVAAVVVGAAISLPGLGSTTSLGIAACVGALVGRSAARGTEPPR